MLWVLDSTVLIDHLRGRPAAARVSELLARGDVPATTAINVEEIICGLREKEAPAAQRLCAGLEILEIDASSAWLAGTWRREYAGGGVTLTQADCLIAASAYRHHAVLATGNPKDFPVRGLQVDHWPVGR